MTMPLVMAPGTPYITPDMLQREPVGISWGSLVPRNATTSQDLNAILQDICQQATGLADGYCNQVLRATQNNETLRGPDFRLTIDNHSGEARAMMNRSPILQVVSVLIASAKTYPRTYTTIPPGYYEVEIPPIGVYGTSSPADSGEGGQSILIAPGFLNRQMGRNAYRVNITYINGWPHTSLTTRAAAGATTILVDDCTGWAPVTAGGQGAVGILYDGGLQEAVTVTAATATYGPGTLTLGSPLVFPHNPGVMLSTMPGQIRWATALFAASMALTRGATTTTIHTTGGGSSAGSPAPEQLSSEAELILHPFRRGI